jgi:hypothetical protein
LNTSLSSTDEFQITDSYARPSHLIGGERRATYEAREPRFELGLWLLALRSYFESGNHPFVDPVQSAVLTRDWSHEMVIARQAMLNVSLLALKILHLEGYTTSARHVVGSAENVGNAGENVDDVDSIDSRLSLVDLAESIGDLATTCETLLRAPEVGFYAWSAIGNILSRELDHSDIARKFEQAASQNTDAELPGILLEPLQKLHLADDNESDIMSIVSNLCRLLQRLHFVDDCLQRDQPLKQTLPIFCLIYSESRMLLDFIDSRVLSVGESETPVFEVLDGMNYAIAMELRKVFGRELIGLASIRQSPAIYARVENAHGLLRDCFQQSILSVAQLLDHSLDVARLFGTFQTRLQQSLTLRRDLWTLLQLVKRAEQERDHYPIARLLERLNVFREGSLRYLMYKDWEACERFMEEVAAARGAVEVTPVVHRFSAYLETLFGQVNMRNVLLDHEFDYSSADD